MLYFILGDTNLTVSYHYFTERFLPKVSRTNVSTELSPFREEIPYNRQCTTANIPLQYCTCNGRVGISPEFAQHHVRAAKESVTSLHELLRSHGLCKNSLVYEETLEASVSFIRFA